MKVLATLVSSDWYQKFLPLYHYCAAKNLPDWTVRTFVRGAIDPAVCECYEIMAGAGWKNIEMPIPDTLPPSGGVSGNQYATNVCRWFLGWERFSDLEPDCVLMTDADLLLFADPYVWHAVQAERCGGAYAGHRGPKKKPFRPEISSAGWRGDYERVAGGFVFMTPRWFSLTAAAVEKYHKAMWSGSLPFQPFREMDEVILGRIIKASGMHTPPAGGGFPAELRGVHLGDFRPNMAHRWTNMVKMQGKLSASTCHAFRRLERDEPWRQMCALLGTDENIGTILTNLRTHISAREP